MRLKMRSNSASKLRSEEKHQTTVAEHQAQRLEFRVMNDVSFMSTLKTTFRFWGFENVSTFSKCS